MLQHYCKTRKKMNETIISRFMLCVSELIGQTIIDTCLLCAMLTVRRIQSREHLQSRHHQEQKARARCWRRRLLPPWVTLNHNHFDYCKLIFMFELESVYCLCLITFVSFRFVGQVTQHIRLDIWCQGITSVELSLYSSKFNYWSSRLTDIKCLLCLCRSCISLTRQQLISCACLVSVCQ